MNDTTTTTTQVITYQHAYVSGTSSLCDACAANAATLARLPALGPVSHGAHDGWCDGCVPAASLGGRSDYDPSLDAE